MKFAKNKKNDIVLYILEKIYNNEQENLALLTSEKFNINKSTIYSYLKEMEQEGIIRKIKRGCYELTEEKIVLNFKNEDLDEITEYNKFIKPLLGNIQPNVMGIWDYAVGEMFNNAIEHSKCKNISIVICKNYLNTFIKIEDDGIGIFENIREHFKLKTVDEAVLELFKGKLTTDPANHSGEGIFFTSKLVDKFYIMSSDRIFTTNKYNNEEMVEIDKGRGTCLYMILSNFSNRNAENIFKMYSDENFNFNRTVIPLKNIFDMNPVSRSQAKRICGGLSKFKIVEIDFEDIEWMGQGFADQLFRVFHNQNPEIELIPLNMNESVNAMYKHVMSRDDLPWV